MPRRVRAHDTTATTSTTTVSAATNHNHEQSRPGMSTTTHYKGSRGVVNATTLSNNGNDNESGSSNLCGPLNTNVITPTAATPQSSQQPPRPPTPLHPSAQSVAAAIAVNRTRGKLDISTRDHDPRKGLLREAFFPDWRDDASSADLKPPEEMQKQDPLATQIWKLYSKTKTQLPNQERMENLTWRMMAMNLRRKEREQARYERVAPPLAHAVWGFD